MEYMPVLVPEQVVVGFIETVLQCINELGYIL
jgi:hypothetical protein